METTYSKKRKSKQDRYLPDVHNDFRPFTPNQSVEYFESNENTITKYFDKTNKESPKNKEKIDLFTNNYIQNSRDHITMKSRLRKLSVDNNKYKGKWYKVQRKSV